MKEIICPECSIMFADNKKLNRHIKEVHRPANESYKYKCLQCDNRYKRKDHLQRHIESIHERKSYNCNICYNPIISKDKLKRHYKNIHEVIYCTKCDILGFHICKEVKYQCEYCTKSYNKSYFYENHLLKHKIEKRKKKDYSIVNKIKSEFKLDFKKFKIENKKLNFSNNNFFNNLNKNIEYDYFCEFCIKTFKYKSYLVKHVKNCKNKEIVN